MAKKVADKTGGEKGRSYFINIKGPELLNKYVGETERQIRLVFQRAREKSEEGWPVIVFFDEMDSMFRTRGSGISSDMESTIVPQLLAEIDGVEGLRNVIVIGATNREDLIDPAILRPGRLDVKIKIERPNADAARQIFARYLTDEIPIAADERQCRDDDRPHRRRDVPRRRGQPVPRGHLPERRQGDPVLQGLLVRGDDREHRAPGQEAGDQAGDRRRRRGVSTQDLLDSIKQEYKEHEDLPNTTNPDDWAKISGKKGERIVFIRTLVKGRAEADARRRPGHRTGRHRPVPLAARRDPRSGPQVMTVPAAVTGVVSDGSRRSRWLRCLDDQGLRHRDRVRHPGRGRRQQPGASSVLVAADQRPASSCQPTASRIGWDFEDEQPGHDARGFAVDDLLAPDIETHLVNAVLTNGARYYVDHAHPEISTPECLTALEVVRYDRAAEEIIRALMAGRRTFCRDGAEILCHKNNSDGKGNSYGCHENYLLARAVPFGRIVAQVTPHFVTRQIVIGAGKVGCELPGMSADDVPFQISQRADFFEEEVGLETTLKRPIVNTRDEPHCDASKYRRLHVIVGDANMSEVATFLKVGTTAIVLAMIEDDALGDDWLLANPVAAIRQVSHDPTLQRTILLRRRPAGDGAGGAVGAARAGPQVRALARPRARRRGGRRRRAAPVGGGADRPGERPGSVADVGRLGGQAAADRRATPSATASTVGDARLKALDLQYHDLRPDQCLADRVRPADDHRRPPTSSSAMTEPPTTTRAYFRGRCLAKWPADIVAANWDSLVFDVGRRSAAAGADDGTIAWDRRACR